MIPRAVEIKVRSLLKTKLSNRRIARQVGISKGTVKAIKDSPDIRPRRFIPKIKRAKEHKCETCGGLIKTEICLLCHPEVGYYDEPN